VKFEFECVPDLPVLAWGATLRQGEPAIRVLHGSQVEIREDSFFEGAWDGPFEAFRFDQAATVAGSGARIETGRVLFCGPSHMGERLQSIRVGDELFVSNSLPFLLALSGERLDPKHPRYYWDFLDFLRVGIKVKQKRLRLLGPRFVELHDCCNLRIDSDLSATRLEKPLVPSPRDFGEYRSLLERTLQGVIVNARHEQRIQSYRPVTMLSQGYDSVAVSALASRAGCREAVTFRRSGGKNGYEDDSGAAIAACLGLSITEYDRMDFHKLPEAHPDDIAAWGTVEVAVMEKQVAGSLLLNGKYADNLWPGRGGPQWGILSDTGRPLLQDADALFMAGYALSEFRLRTGFIDFPPGSVGAIHAPAIHAISRSQAMKPWSIPRYDKPLPRRIAEEAGVPRHLFGQKSKKGGPARPASVPRSLAGRIRVRVFNWMPSRCASLLLFGNRFHPNWSKGSFCVQRGMDRAIEPYLEALGNRESSERIVARLGYSPVRTPG
jgi:hypothetical protein